MFCSLASFFTTHKVLLWDFNSIFLHPLYCASHLSDSQAYREPFYAGCGFNCTHRLNMATGRTR